MIDIFYHIFDIYAINALSSDLLRASFNLQKGKVAFMSYEDRVTLLQSLRAVDVVFPENDWEQKVADIKKYNIGLFAIGDDWAGHFDYLSKYCKVVYMPRTANISSTEIRRIIMQKKD